jgi:tricorn protease-like protein
VTGAAYTTETIASVTDKLGVGELTFCNLPEKALETSQEKEYYSRHKASGSKELV